MMTDRKILELYKKDLEEAQPVKTVQNEYVSNMINIYKGDVQYTKVKGSTFVSKEVFKQVEWAKAQYKHPFVSNDTIVRLAPQLGSGNVEFSQQSEALMNYFYIKKFNRYNFMTDALHTLLVEGTLVVRTGWEYDGEMRQIEVPIVGQDPNSGEQIQLGSQIVNKEVPIVNKPTASIVKADNIFIDPTATTMEEVQYIVQRREVRLHELKEAGIYKNLDILEKRSTNPLNKDNYTEPYTMEKNPTLSFNMEDTDRRKMYMYEYWGYNKLEENGDVKPVVCCWIDDTIVRLEENPYPDQKIPFLVLQFIKEPHTLWGKALTEMISEHQRIKTGLMRGIFDDLAQSNNTQKGVQKGNLDPINMKRFLNGESFEFNLSPTAFYQGNYNRIPSEIFKVIQDVDYDKQLLSGVIPMQGGQGAQAIYGSQASKTGQLSSLMLKELDVVNNIAENLIKPMLMKWLIYMYELLEPEEIMNITGMQYVEPEKELIVNYADDFDIDISTQQTDEIKASEMTMLMQTLGNTIPFDITKLMMAEIAKLKKMPNLAKQIIDYQPQPDPYEEQLKQIELQKAQLELQLMQMEGQADAQLKSAKAKEADAKATATSTGTIQSKYGIDYQQKMKEMEVKHQMEMEKLREQARLKDKGTMSNNVGIPTQNPQPVGMMDVQNQTI